MIEGAENNMDGYTETEAMLTERASKGDLGNYPAFNTVNTYRNNNAVPAALTGKRSPWFMPSVGQWFDVMVNLAGRQKRFVIIPIIIGEMRLTELKCGKRSTNS